MNKRTFRSSFKTVALITMSVIFASIFIACDEDGHSNWLAEKWSLSMDRVDTFAIAVDAGTPVLAISGKDTELLNSLKNDQQLISNNQFIVRPGASGGDNFLLFYEKKGKEWSLRYGWDHPQVNLNSRMTTSSFATETYNLLTFENPEFSSVGVVVDNKMTGFAGNALLHSSTIMVGTAYCASAGKKTTFGGVSYGDDDLSLKKRPFKDFQNDPMALFENVGTSIETGKAPLITDVEIISSENSNFENKEALFVAWVREGVLYLAKASSSRGIMEDTKLTLMDKLSSKNHLLSLAFSNQHLYIFIANGKIASYIPIDLKEWKALETKELATTQEEISKIRVVNDRDNHLVGSVLAGKNLSTIIPSNDQFIVTELVNTVTDFDISIDNKKIWLCTLNDKLFKIYNAVLK